MNITFLSIKCVSNEHTLSGVIIRPHPVTIVKHEGYLKHASFDQSWFVCFSMEE